jgi:hypothetical protein
METQENIILQTTSKPIEYRIFGDYCANDTYTYVILVDGDPIMYPDMSLARIEKILIDLCDAQIEWLQKTLNKDYKKYYFYINKISPSHYVISKQSLGTICNGSVKPIHTIKIGKIPIPIYKPMLRSEDKK